MTRSNFTQWRTALAATLASLGVLAACGGGGSESPTAAVSSGLAGTASYSLGPISGFGSIIVGGVRYDDSSASVSDEDGVSHDRSALKLGMTVQVEGGQITRQSVSSIGAAHAQRIRFGSEIVGPVQVIDSNLLTLQVLGQTVDVTVSTVIDSSWVGGLAAVTAGTVVEVHGLPDATTGHIVATRIEPRANATRYAVRGVVSELDAAAKTLVVNGLMVSYATLATVPADLAVGQTVRVQLQTTPAAGVWTALRLSNGRRSPDGSVREAHIEGVITAYTSAQAFTVNGLQVDAGGASFPDGADAIVLGARVEVEGAVSNGVLVASKVEVEDRRDRGRRDVELHGSITSIDTVAKTFVLRGLTVAYGNGVSFKDGTEAALAVGSVLEVHGAVSADRTQLTANRIEFKAAGST